LRNFRKCENLGDFDLHCILKIAEILEKNFSERPKQRLNELMSQIVQAIHSTVTCFGSARILLEKNDSAVARVLDIDTTAELSYGSAEEEATWGKTES
jgi:hypothetical protein